MTTDSDMSTEFREHLSCLMDGEINRETGRFLVRRLGADEELSATWARYHVVRDCLRNQEGGFASLELTARVRRAIENETAPSASRRGMPGWLKPVAGAAVAASVALLAILAIDPAGQPGGEPALTPQSVAASEGFTSPQGLDGPTLSSQVSLAGGNDRINPYLLRHYQAVGSAGGRGFVTFVPIVVTSPGQAGARGDEGSAEDAGPTVEAEQAQPQE